MKKMGDIAIGIALISLVVGVVSRVTMKPVTNWGLMAHAFLDFAGVCLLFAIAIFLREK